MKVMQELGIVEKKLFLNTDKRDSDLSGIYIGSDISSLNPSSPLAFQIGLTGI